MPSTGQKSLILILARELATNLATPVFVVDPDGTLVFYNEAAELILGEAFEDAGELTREQWGTMFSPQRLGGEPMVPELPLSRALTGRSPAHDRLSITGRDGVRRDIAVTAIPLLGGRGEFAGAVAIFWEDGGAGAALEG